MTNVKEQILKDSKGNYIGVFLTSEEYQFLIDKIEDLEDTIAYLKAKLEADNEPPIPLRDFILQK
jgi:hypothetical protein